MATFDLPQILIDLPSTVRVRETAAGAFLEFIALPVDARRETAFLPRHVFAAGRIAGLRRFMACHRFEPYWMKPAAGRTLREVPVETQYLLAERQDGKCVLLIPLIDGAFRCALQGHGEERLELVAESGDPAVRTDRVVGLFISVGDDPYAMLEESASAVCQQMGLGHLRRDKPAPAFLDQFGWCTWDAFYQDVTAEQVRRGLESFACGGLSPRMLILDDGWQSVRHPPQELSERRLTAFAANEKFPGDLGPTVQMAKEQFGVQTFLVWQALNGYWGGVDGAALPGYGVRELVRRNLPEIVQQLPTIDTWWGPMAGVVDPEHIYRFFQDYHRHLRRQGVDGAKVDNQATIEALGYTFGGRVAMYRAYREALEGSAQTQFRGNLINCMSCSMEGLYTQLASNVTRTSMDYYPNRPETHGMHLYANAQVSAWFGEFTWPDWDMFQSSHAAGAFHAAGRAISGGPVYVSDKPDGHDFELLRRVALPDGRVLRCLGPGRPTRDCLFADVTQEPVLLKIFNRNAVGGVIGAFHCRYRPGAADGAPAEADAIAGQVRPADVYGLVGERFAVFAHRARQLRTLEREAAWEIVLHPLEYEIFTMVPIVEDLAPIGLVDLFNSGGVFVNHFCRGAGVHEMTLRAGGLLLFWAGRRPARLIWQGEEVPFVWNRATGSVEVMLPPNKHGSLVVELTDSFR